MKNWKQILVTEDASLKDIIKILNDNASQFVIVSNPEFRLLGVVTDGDIRRSILNDFDLNIPIKKVMNKDPIYASSNYSNLELIKLMKKFSIQHIPILSNSKIIDLVSLKDLINIETDKTTIVIMAGGLGRRLRPLTEKTPKPMLLIDEKPILEHILKNFIDQGFVNFKISVNYKSEVIKKYFKDGRKFGVNIDYLEEKKALGTAGCLSMLSINDNKPFILINGDIITNLNFKSLLNYHKKQNSIATVVVKNETFQIPFGVVKITNKKIKNIDEKPIQSFYINAGIYVLSPNFLKFIKNDTIDMPDLLKLAIKSKKIVASFPLKEDWIDIGEFNQFNKLQKK